MQKSNLDDEQQAYLSQVQCKLKVLIVWNNEKKGLMKVINQEIKGQQRLNYFERTQKEDQLDALFKSIPLVLIDPGLFQYKDISTHLLPKTQEDLFLLDVLIHLRECIKCWEAIIGKDGVRIVFEALDLIATAIGKRNYMPARFDDDS